MKDKKYNQKTTEITFDVSYLRVYIVSNMLIENVFKFKGL